MDKTVWSTPGVVVGLNSLTTCIESFAEVAVGAAFLLSVGLPISSLSWVGIAAFCVYILATTDSASTRQGSLSYSRPLCQCFGLAYCSNFLQIRF
jgi:hypothetical protein